MTPSTPAPGAENPADGAERRTTGDDPDQPDVAEDQRTGEEQARKNRENDPPA